VRFAVDAGAPWLPLPLVLACLLATDLRLPARSPTSHTCAAATGLLTFWKRA
jgi:hypothetical protein